MPSPVEGGAAIGVPARQRQGPGESAGGCRLVGGEHGALGATARQQVVAGVVWVDLDQVEDLVDEGRARERAAVLVAVLPAEAEALGRARGAGVKQVALLVGLLRTAQVGVPELAAALLGQQRVQRRSARELAVLQARDEERPCPRRTRPVGTENAHAAARGPAPVRHRRRLERLDRVGEAGLLAAGKLSDSGELGQELGGDDAAPQLEGGERDLAAVAAARQRCRPAVRALGQFASRAGQGAQTGAVVAGLAQALEVARRLLPGPDRRAHALGVAAAQAPFEAVDRPRRPSTGPSAGG